MDKCPKCDQPATYYSPTYAIYDCGATQNGERFIVSDRCKVNQAVLILRRHDSPAVNTATHALAAKLLVVLTGEEREHR
jgi:hypothetical protein